MNELQKGQLQEIYVAVKLFELAIIGHDRTMAANGGHEEIAQGKSEVDAARAKVFRLVLTALGEDEQTVTGE